MAMAMAMASLAATPSVASPTSLSTRLLVFHPLNQRPIPSPRSLFNLKYKFPSLRVKACNSHPSKPHSHLSGSTRTLTSLFGMAVLLVKAIGVGNWLNTVNSVGVSGGSLFFAALRDRPSGSLNTPLTVVAAGLGKWLDIYSGVLMVRVLLSWFPNIPWERQPLSAIRDLCDPYLNLFRNIIPPVFDTLDVSPLLAFAVLGTLGSILQTAI
ncbi:hypothetical protein RJT34_16862 [Clitoria ternatea]|uniref:Uncharacterized protein n=1 Tax=Clitoria ternatea TaxID=43366 RepID=A0AAN9JB07_CLITE